MSNIIKFIRGAEASIPTLNQGEPAYTTDTHKVFIGDGALNYEVLMVHDSIKCRSNATEAPTETNDSTEGYVINSLWTDVTNDKSYICLDTTEDNAVWIEITASKLSDLTDVGVTTPTNKNALMADGDSWESRALVEADISDLGTSIAMVADKLSVFATTTSAELAGVISDEIGAGKARFDTSVTAKTTTALLTVAEAGTILVSAAAAYTITLPTAVGNTGLTYHFIKTDANYNLITLAANGAQTFNYENSTGAPVATYARLNTYCAEVTIVSDGANWQCINERLGQVPECWVYLSANQTNLTASAWNLVHFDTKEYDIGNNFDAVTNHRYTFPISGKYQLTFNLVWDYIDMQAPKNYGGMIQQGGSILILEINLHSSVVSQCLGLPATMTSNFVASDYIACLAVPYVTGNTLDLYGGGKGVTFLQVKLVSKN
jgi:hypothetical protein